MSETLFPPSDEDDDRNQDHAVLTKNLAETQLCSLHHCEKKVLRLWDAGLGFRANGLEFLTLCFRESEFEIKESRFS